MYGRILKWGQIEGESHFSLGPHPAGISAMWWLFFFQRQFIFRYFKNSFESDFQTAAAALAPSVAAFSSAPVVPAAKQSLFLGSQHSFDLILNAICNPLQDTEACSPTWCTFSITFSICLFFLCSLCTQPFLSSLSAALLNYSRPPTSVRRWKCHYIVSDAVITLLQGAAALLLVFFGDHMTCTQLLNNTQDCSPLQMLTHCFIIDKVSESRTF